jgi:hypothetical protein
MYERNIPLDDETATKAIANQEFLENYVSDIRNNPDKNTLQSISL